MPCRWRVVRNKFKASVYRQISTPLVNTKNHITYTLLDNAKLTYLLKLILLIISYPGGRLKELYFLKKGSMTNVVGFNAVTQV